MAAGALDDARGDRQAVAEVLVVAQVLSVCEQVSGAFVGVLALVQGELPLRRALLDSRGDSGGFAFEDARETYVDPLLGLLRALLVEDVLLVPDP